MSSEPDSLAYMSTDVDKSNSYDLPRWQTHHGQIENVTSPPHPSQSQYSYSQQQGPPPPPPQSLTAGRLPSLQSTPSQSRQRLPHIIDSDHQSPGHSQYLSPSNPQLSRSASLSTSSSSRARRHHQPEDLEISVHPDSSTPRQHSQGSGYFPPSNVYHSQPIQQSSSPARDQTYADMYYTQGSGPPKRSQGSLDSTGEGFC